MTTELEGSAKKNEELMEQRNKELTDVKTKLAEAEKKV
jgi:hypothetical protein